LFQQYELLATVTDDTYQGVVMWLPNMSGLNLKGILNLYPGASLPKWPEWLRSSINAITFSRDGKWLASASSDNSVRLWDVEARNPKPVWTVHRYSYGAFGIVFSPDGRRVLERERDHDPRRGMSPRGAGSRGPLEGHTAWGYVLATSPDGRSMASGSGDSTVIVRI